MAKTHYGMIGVPDAKDKGKYTACRYQVTCNKAKSKKNGLNGGKITKLTIWANGEITATYDKGWIVEIGRAHV